MCGIVACLRDGVDIAPAVRAIQHRGTRGKVEHLRSGGMMAHVRLPIVGLGHEWDQPVLEGRSWTIAFVGEVLDFRERDPQAVCDLATVIEAWCSNDRMQKFRSFDGFWAVVAHNALNGSLTVLCDYLAQKPMYYRPDLAAVASEPDALVALGEVHPDEVYFSAVIKWGYCPDVERTPYEEVKKIPPGGQLLMFSNGMHNCSVVDPLLACAGGPKTLRSEVELAVRRRVLSSDVPVAMLLSGGVDSSIVYHYAKKYGTVKTYFTSELVRGVEVLEIDPAVTHCCWTAVDDKTALAHMQEPVDLGSLVPQISLAEAVKETVCLTGDGADELFGGYGRSMRYDSQASDVWQELVAWHLPRLDRIMMRKRIEVRSPFLARRVAGIALTIPHDLRRDKSELRHVFESEIGPLAHVPKKPLRTAAVEQDREARSKHLVGMFRMLRGLEKRIHGAYSQDR